MGYGEKIGSDKLKGLQEENQEKYEFSRLNDLQEL